MTKPFTLYEPPIYRTGNKYRHMSIILTLLPKDICTFVDLFGGSGVVGLNVLANELAQEVLYNEADPKIHNLVKSALKDEMFPMFAASTSKCYEPTKEGYLELRGSFNELDLDASSARYNAALYALHCRSFSNGIRFNSKGEFNLPWGDRDRVATKLNTLARIKAEIPLNAYNFSCQDFRQVEIPDNSFVFVDSPYYNSTATYNEKGGWGEQDEKDLYALLSDLDERGVQFMMTNTLWNRGRHNPLLQAFLEGGEWHVTTLKCNHGNTSFRKSDKRTEELLVRNFT